MSLLSSLNPQQQEAVQRIKGPVLILAGAGTGKTKAITHRIAYMIEEKHINPRNILAVTFTNKAAREMKERVQQLLSKGSYSPTMGTFHSVSAKILREHIHLLGYQENYSIYDTDDSTKVIKNIYKELSLDPKKINIRSIMNMISGAKNQLLTPKVFEEQAVENLQVIGAEVYKKYQQQLKASNAVDFDDLIMLTVQLFEQHPKVLELYQQDWQYIHIDEYQDVNYAQTVWTKYIAELYNNICVVGDDWQGIYSWRGANIENILHFPREYPQTHIIKLEQNYRSTQIILDTAQSIIEHNIHRTEKRLWADKTEGAPIEIFSCHNEREEGDRILLSIQENINKKILESMSDVVILYRTNAQSRAIEEACLRNKIPYQIIGGTKFYERMEIKDILAYLTITMNPNDQISLQRIINTPQRGIGATTWLKITDIAGHEHTSIWDILVHIEERQEFNESTQKKLLHFRNIILTLQQYSRSHSVSKLIEHILEITDYINYIDDKSINAEQRIENIHELQSVSRKYDHLEPELSLQSFLEEISLISEADNDIETEKLTLMTIHASKGLEFEAVYIAGMEENIFPHARTLYNENEMEEERRLAYVAITRAKNLCYLSHCQSRVLYGEISHNKISRFIENIPTSLLATKNLSRDDEPRYSGIEEEHQNYDFHIGKIVSHPHFGKGEIIEIRGDILTIRFSSGTKTLAASIAPLY